MIKKQAVWSSLFAAVACASLASCATSDDTDDSGNEIVPDVTPHTGVCAATTRFHCFAQVVTESDDSIVPAASKTTPAGFGPSDLVAAYKLKSVTTDPGTIAVVDAYNYPAAASDLAKYRSQYGLPACTVANGCFKIVNQDGKASPLPASAPSGDDWTVEAALDLDMASAACPTCKLILVEADDDQGDGLYIAQGGAVTAGASVISNSWGGPEDGSELTNDKTYFTHTGVATFVSTGDDGYTGTSPQYPATSALVTAVGGTSLKKSGSTYKNTAWSDAGSSCSSDVPKPSWQTSTVTATVCKNRANADVSAVADPNTAVAVYNAANGGFIQVGGTSASSPFVAGVYTLYGLATTAPGWAYSHTADFTDVTSGSNGTCKTALCKAAKGWDGPTGLGVPNGSKL